MTLQQLVAAARSEIREIAVEEAAADPGVVLIDVREPSEFEAGRLPGAANIPRGVLEFKTADHPLLADRSKKLFLYCRSGGRSALAAQSLQRMGYTGVLSIAGGFEEWVRRGRPIITDTTRYGG